eukprot:gb/GFBE01045320.1/.p1 GENE.gb/GFBE01045320.1/~~gb/GFBE01045320.1/.p1  ORF type:complete len:703 (+),score=80.19 gb/GFBE01045320.1/:1-2109(+)
MRSYLCLSLSLSLSRGGWCGVVWGGVVPSPPHTTQPFRTVFLASSCMQPQAHDAMAADDHEDVPTEVIADDIAAHGNGHVEHPHECCADCGCDDTDGSHRGQLPATEGAGDEDTVPDHEIPTLLPELSLQLSPDISKAIDLEDCLENFGEHWIGKVTGGFGVSEEDQDLAKPATDIDDFLSHDWVTDGRLKFITLLIVYNSNTAALLAISISSAFGLLQAFIPELRFIEGFYMTVGGKIYRVETAGFLGLVSGMATYVLVLMFWQRLRSYVFCKSRRVFMDKLCIDQRDPARKAKGILGLAGFLRISDRLVVLWSPRYFTRIWCVYEIATWMYLQKPLSKIVIAPVAQGAFVALVMAGMILVVSAMVWLARLESYYIYGILLTATIAAIMILPLHLLRRLVRDLRKMPMQIKNFSFANSECFCCDVGHVIPGTDTVINCDRQVITNKLTQWFADAAEAQGARKSLGGRMIGPVALFDRYVRREFGRHILNRVGGARVTYRVATIASLPGWFYMTDRFHMLTIMDEGVFWRLLMHYVTATLAFFPSIIRLALEFANILDRFFGVPTNIFADWAVTLLGVVGIGALTLGWLGLLDYTLMQEDVLYQILVVSGTSILTVLLYLPDVFQLFHELRMGSRKVRVKSTNTLKSGASSAKQKVQKVMNVSKLTVNPKKTRKQEAWTTSNAGGSTSSNMSKVVPFHRETS